jgi:flagellar FliL protein
MLWAAGFGPESANSGGAPALLNGLADMTTPAAPATPPAPAPAKSRRGLVLVATATLVVLLGGGGAAYWMYGGNTTAEGAEPAAPEDTGPGAAIPLEPFVVNLADPGGTRFLRVSLSLVVAEEDQAKELEENAVMKMKVRSAVLELLALQSAERLITPEGKSELKKAIAGAAAKAVMDLHVTDVLFSEFVVQF